MVLLKLKCDPGSEQATLSVRITTAAPNLSLSSLKSEASEPVLNIQIHVRCQWSTNPSRPITILTAGTILDNKKPEAGYMDSLALGMLGAGLVCTNAQERKYISLGYFRVHRARQEGDDSPNLGERPDISFLTIPSQASGEEAVISHTLTAGRLFAFSDKFTADDVHKGEQYSITLRDDYVGTTWWCWGGLNGELKEKKMHAFSEGVSLTGYAEKPSQEEIEKEGWVCGEDVSQLRFVVEEGGDACAVEIVD
ncbi:hypothetical protein GQ53DRAFT_711555 [Thozetella sp. PMI_491]|nr:hypothetical protein GQ53DRAFT_711555 [Thozetella sp. PMI_491]